MKPIAIIVAALMLFCLTACKSGAEESASVAAATNDPIYNESAAFNDLNKLTSSVEDELVSDTTNQSTVEAFRRYAAALAATEQLSSYRMTAGGAVAMEIEGSSVGLEKATAKLEIASSGNFYVSRTIDNKDKHNNSVSQTVEYVWADKQSSHKHTRTEFKSFVNSGDDYISTKETAYKPLLFDSVLGAAYSIKAENIASATVTEADGVATIKFTLNENSAAELCERELKDASIIEKPTDIAEPQFTLTTVVDAQGVLVAGSVVVRADVSGTVYSVTREFSLSDKNSSEILCGQPEWV